VDKGWQGLGNLRMEGEEEKDAGLSGKGDRDTFSVFRSPLPESPASVGSRGTAILGCALRPCSYRGHDTSCPLYA